MLIHRRHAVADREMVFWLLDRGGDLNKTPHIDITPLSFAVKNAAPDLLRDLLDHSGDVQKGEVLQYALDRNTDVVAVLGILLDRGAPLDAVMYEDHHGSMQLYFFFERHTPLCKAAAIGNAEAVRFLLERGADPDVQNSKGRTALECAEEKGHAEIVEMLAQWPRTSDAGKHLPKIPLLIALHHKVWVKTESLVDDGTKFMVGDVKCIGLALDDPRGCPLPVSSGGVTFWVEVVEMVDDGKRAVQSPDSGQTATRDDCVESEHVKEVAAPPEGPVENSPGCWSWMAR